MKLQNLEWLDPDGKIAGYEKIISYIDDYIRSGKKVFVGSDSMMYSDRCIFATAICLYDPDNRRATYYYTRQKTGTKKYKELKVRIFKEVQDSINIGLDLMEKYKNTDIEIHVDVGRSKRSKTRTIVDTVKGWVSSYGFNVKVKPNSWASSSVADWHTK